MDKIKLLYESYWVSPDGTMHRVPFSGHSKFFMDTVRHSKYYQMWIQVSMGRIMVHENSLKMTDMQNIAIANWILENSININDIYFQKWNEKDFEEWVECFSE